MIITLLILVTISFPLTAGPLADYNLNTYNSLVLNGARCIGMGGAVVALGDDAADVFYNSAAASKRNETQKSWFEWDYSFSYMNILAADNNDYRNSNDVLTDYKDANFNFYAFSLSLLFNRIGVTLGVNGAKSELNTAGNTYFLDQGNIMINISYEAITNQLYLGIGIFLPTVTFKDENEDELATYDFKEGTPANTQFGAIYKFKKIPLSLGANLLLNVNGTEATSTNATIIDLPKKVLHPTTFRLGAAWRFEIITNKSLWEFKDKKGKLKTKKMYTFKPEYLLVSGAINFVGKVDNALDIISFSDGTEIIRSGTTKLVEPAIGIELAFPTWFKFNAGYYYEGPRLEGSTGRHHFTCNIDARVIKIFGLDIAASFTMDWSRNLWGGGLGVKIWKY